ncbi:MAG: hypothetical protein JST59_30225 [Actinobacteria bacterium]|nr:hypothetical protein [Actinomycetota bacterium]
MSRRRYHALIEVDRDDQLDELALLAGDAEIGLAVLGSDDGEHLDFVNVVDVDGREDGVYVFSEHADAERFADAVDYECDGTEMVEFHRAFVAETPVNLGAAAERLIAAERGDVLEDLFGPALAEDVREGTALEVVLRKLREVGEGDSDVAVLVRRWIELDERTRSAASEADAAEASRRRAYTVVGCRGRGGAPYVTTVRTPDGPRPPSTSPTRTSRKTGATRLTSNWRSSRSSTAAPGWSTSTRPSRGERRGVRPDDPLPGEGPPRARRRTVPLRPRRGDHRAASGDLQAGGPTVDDRRHPDQAHGIDREARPRRLRGHRPRGDDGPRFRVHPLP